MKFSQIKNSITFLFLILFLSMKMVGLHALTHGEDNDHNDHALHCTICDNATALNLTPTLAPDSQEFSIENKELVVTRSAIKHYSFIASNTIATNQLLSRPPPFSF